jgi:hypothetical protein
MQQPLMQQPAKVLVLVAQADLQRTQALLRRMADAGFDTHASVDGMLGDSRQQAWDRMFPAACCTVVVWSRASLGEPWFVGRAEQARLHGVECPLLLDSVIPDELPVGHQGKVCGDLGGWSGSPDESPFPAIVKRVRMLARARTMRQRLRFMKWASLLGALVLGAGLVVTRAHHATVTSTSSAAIAAAASPSRHAPAAMPKVAARQSLAHAGNAPSQRVTIDAGTTLPKPRRLSGTAAKPALVGTDWPSRAAEASRGCKMQQGDGCDRLGWLQEFGNGVRQSLDAAFTSYERGCTLGCGSACYNAARMYEYGLGTTRDPARARQRRHRGCELAYSFACAEERRDHIAREAWRPYRD